MDASDARRAIVIHGTADRRIISFVYHLRER
jgi:hypothetical protein